jgi:peroxiredoxin
MGEKLQQGDRFPRLTLNLINGDTLRVPEDINSRYLVLLFYRGYW